MHRCVGAGAGLYENCYYIYLRGQRLGLYRRLGWLCVCVCVKRNLGVCENKTINTGYVWLCLATVSRLSVYVCLSNHFHKMFIHRMLWESAVDIRGSQLLHNMSHIVK